MDNLDNLLQKLDDMTGDISTALEKGLRQAGKKIQGDAKLLVPKDTGRLANSIIESISYEGNDIVETVGTNTEYASYVEFGTGPAGERSPKMVPSGVSLKYRKDGWGPVYIKELGEFRYTEGQPAKPFLYPAFKQNQANVRDIIAKAVRKELRGND